MQDFLSYQVCKLHQFLQEILRPGPVADEEQVPLGVEAPDAQGQVRQGWRERGGGGGGGG